MGGAADYARVFTELKFLRCLTGELDNSQHLGHQYALASLKLLATDACIHV